MPDIAVSSLIVKVQADSAAFATDMHKVEATVNSAMKSVDTKMAVVSTSIKRMGADYYTATNGMSAHAQRFANDIQRQLDNFGKTREQLLLQRAATVGATEATKANIIELERMRTAQEGVAKSAEHMGIGFNTARSKTEPLILAHELLQGNYTRLIGSVMVMGEQTGIMNAVFTKTGAVVLGASAAVAGFAIAAVKGLIETEKLQQSLKLTADYAGLTEGRYNQMAITIAQSTQTHVGASRTILAGLVDTGQFSGRAIQTVAAAAASFSQASGKSAEEVVSDFAQMTGGVSKWAEEHNNHYHFLTAAQLEYIRRLEEQGKTEEAYIVAGKAMLDHTDRHAEKVGFLIQRYRTFGDNIDFIKEKLLNLARAETPEDRLAAAQARLADLTKPGPHGSTPDTTTTIRGRTVDLAALARADVAKAQAEVDRVQADAALKSEQAEYQKRLDVAKKYLEELHNKFATAAQKQAKEIAEYTQKADIAGTPAAQRAKDIEDIKAQYKDKKAGAVSIDDSGQRAADQLLKSYQSQLDKIHELTTAEVLLRDIEDGRFKGANEGTLRLLQLEARQIDFGKQTEAFEKTLAKSSTAHFKDAMQPINDYFNDLEARQKRLESLLSKTPTAIAEQQRQDMKLLAEALQSHAIDPKQYEEAMQIIENRTKDTAGNMSEFFKKAAHDMQGNMSTFFFDVMEGNLSHLGASFKRYIDKMAADALALQANNYLFGKDFSKTGEVGGLASKGLSALSSWFGGGGGGYASSAAAAGANVGFGVNAGTTVAASSIDTGAILASLNAFDIGTPYVPNNMIAKIHKGERIIPAAENRGGQLGGTTKTNSVVINYHAAPGTDRRTASQHGAELMRQGQVALARLG